jgi:hypothetical protein
MELSTVPPTRRSMTCTHTLDGLYLETCHEAGIVMVCYLGTAVMLMCCMVGLVSLQKYSPQHLLALPPMLHALYKQYKHV